MSETSVLERTEVKIKKPRKFKVVIHNDDFTPIEFVIQLLITHFEKTPDDAVNLTMTIHENGKGIAGVYSKEIAQQKVAEATEDAVSYGFPLKIVAEPV